MTINALLPPEAQAKYEAENRPPEIQFERANAIFAELRRQLEKHHKITEWYHRDGYFVTYDHHIVQFKTKDCPGWLFGIWLTVDEDDNDDSDKSEIWRFECFAQYENNIDKFKPSASEIVQDTVFDWAYYKDNIESLTEFSALLLLKVVGYVAKEPYLAWYRDNSYIDYNWCFVSREEAKAEFDAEQIRLAKTEELQEKQRQEEYDFIVAELARQSISENDYEIVDENRDGVECFPRYCILVRGSALGEGTKAHKCYEFMGHKQWAKFTAIDEKYRRKCKADNCGPLWQAFDNSVIAIDELPRERKK